jgi:hypothetical protein
VRRALLRICADGSFREIAIRAGSTISKSDKEASSPATSRGEEKADKDIKNGG